MPSSAACSRTQQECVGHCSSDVHSHRAFEEPKKERVEGGREGGRREREREQEGARGREREEEGEGERGRKRENINNDRLTDQAGKRYMKW